MITSHFRMQRGAIRLLLIVVGLFGLVTAIHVYRYSHAWNVLNSPACLDDYWVRTCNSAAHVVFWNDTPADPIGFVLHFQTLLPPFLFALFSGIVLGVSAVATERESLRLRVALTGMQTRSQWLRSKAIFNFSLSLFLVGVVMIIQLPNIYFCIQSGPDRRHLVITDLRLYGLLILASGLAAFLVTVFIALLIRPSWIVAGTSLLLICVLTPSFNALRTASYPARHSYVDFTKLYNVHDMSDADAFFTYTPHLQSSYFLSMTYLQAGKATTDSFDLLTLNDSAQSCSEVSKTSATFAACVRKFHVQEVIKYFAPSDFLSWQVVSLAELTALCGLLYVMCLARLQKIRI